MVSVVLLDDEELKVTDVLGVDMGIAEIAADSDGNKQQWIGFEQNPAPSTAITPCERSCSARARSPPNGC